MWSRNVWRRIPTHAGKASDLATELKWMAEGGSQAGATLPQVSTRKYSDRLAWAITAGALLAVVVLAAIHFTDSPKPLRLGKIGSIDTP